MQTFALPLGYVAVIHVIKLGWVVGLEPTHDGATTRCLNHLTIPTILNGDPNRARTDDLQRDRLAF